MENQLIIPAIQGHDHTVVQVALLHVRLPDAGKIVHLSGTMTMLNSQMVLKLVTWKVNWFTH